jgi:ACS family hexuronate transporter-like MFS transporter
VRRWGASAHGAKRSVYTGACLLTSLSLLLPWLGRGWPLLAALLLIGAGALALFPCYYSFVQELSSAHVGKLTGLLSLWVWSVTSPLHSAFGLLVDRTHSYDAGLVVAGLAPWLGVVALKFLWPQSRFPASSPTP